MGRADDLRSQIAARLKFAREMAGLSQSQVAKMLGLHRPSISEAEAGRRKVSAEELSELSRIYDVDIDWLAAAKTVTREEALGRVELAARELAKLKSEDLDLVLELLTALKSTEDSAS